MGYCEVMASETPPDAAIDHLYQLPLDQFVAARNDLARETRGAAAANIRALPKPNVIAWALNQLYWTARPAFDQLVAGSARLRGAQAEALLGRASDLRGADAGHRQAMRDAIKHTTQILERAGHAATPDTIRALTAAFDALPWKNRPGRLARPPAPSGFEALAGLPFAESAEPRPAGRHAEPSQSRREGVAAPAPPETARPGRATAATQRRAERDERAAEREQAAERERQAEIGAARTRMEQTARDAAAASSRVRATKQRLAQTQAAERGAEETLAQARRALREAEVEHRQALRDEMASARALHDAEAALGRLGRKR